MWYGPFSQFVTALRSPPRRKRTTHVPSESEQIEFRLLPTGLVGIWELDLESPGAPGLYQLQVSESWGTSTFQLPGKGAVTLTNVSVEGTTFRARFHKDGLRGKIEAVGSNLDHQAIPQLLTVNVDLKGADVNRLTLTNHAQVQELPKTNSLLKEQILFEIPSLSKALRKGETLQAAELILGWAARTGDFALDGSTVGLTSTATSVADLYYNFFEKDVVGMSCGGYGNYYSSLLKLFEIDSLDIGFGQLPVLTHVTVVIPLLEKGKWNFYLMDPTFGTTFKNPDTGKQGTFFDLIDYRRAGRLSEIDIQTLSLDERDFLSPVPSTIDELTDRGTSPENYVYQWKDYSLFDYLDGSQVLLEDAGYTADLEGFVKLMENRVYNALIYGNQTKMTAARNAFLSELARREITFGF